MSKIREKVLQDVNKERVRQIGLWGDQVHCLSVWSLILGEEVGEVNKAICENIMDGKDIKNVREELIQVAAVAVQIVENIDKNNTNPAF